MLKNKYIYIAFVLSYSVRLALGLIAHGMARKADLISDITVRIEMLEKASTLKFVGTCVSVLFWICLACYVLIRREKK